MLLNLLLIGTMTVSLSLILAGVLFQVFKRQLLFKKRLVQLTQKDYDMPLNFSVESEEERAKPFTNKALTQSISTRLKTQIQKGMTPSKQKLLERKLRDAGYLYKRSAVEFRLFQLFLSSSLVLVSLLLFGRLTSNLGFLILVTVLLGFLGFALPNFQLSKLKAKRVALIQKQMPDFFDMVTLSIEAGMGLDQALSSVCKRYKGPLSEEFMQAVEDMRLGKSRREAFTELRNRIPSRSFQGIMSSLIQSDQLGIGMGHLLRTLTIRIRESQREAAREKAMKAPVKMMFPMIFFIFPSLFIVILGPLVVHLVTKGLTG